jgi:hypothetical protein
MEVLYIYSQRSSENSDSPFVGIDFITYMYRPRVLGVCHVHLLQYKKLEEEWKSGGRTGRYIASSSADILEQNQALALCLSPSELNWK